MPHRKGLSLRGRALMWLSQREHSRKELGAKLRRWAATAQAAAADAKPQERAAGASGADIEALLDALQEAGHLSDVRFTESRVHVRASRFGNRRIEGELRQHGVQLDEQASRQLRESESRRAAELRTSRYGALPADAKERARQARFLAGRGFSPEAIRSAISPRRNDDCEPRMADGSAASDLG
jgi:regulatory protein